MWFLRPDRHGWMASPSRLASPRWCGSSALTITAVWPLHPDWQHPGEVVPPLWPSQLNSLSTQTGSVCVSAQTFLTHLLSHAFIGAVLILVHHQQWIIYVTANSNVQHIALINVKWISDNNDWYQTMINCPNINSKFPSSLHNPQKGPSLGAKNCSAPRVSGVFVDWFDGTAHARSRSTTYTVISPRQFHIWSTSVPRLIHVSSTTRQTQWRPGDGQFNYQLTLSLDPCVNQVQRVLLKQLRVRISHRKLITSSWKCRNDSISVQLSV